MLLVCVQAVSDCRPSGPEAKASWRDDTDIELDVIHSVVFCFFFFFYNYEAFTTNAKLVP